jgi:PAS domain S-box-containing protein
MTTEAVGAGLWIMNVDTRKVWVSQKSRELFHFAPDEEIYYESYFRVIHPDDRDRVNQEVQRALQTGEELRCEYRIVLPDGRIRWIGAHGRSFQKATGEPERILGLSLDITERKQTELKLNWSRTLLDTLIDSTSDLIWSVDSEQFGLLTYNRGLYEYFLQERGIHIEAGMRPEDLLPTEEYAQKWRTFYLKTLEEGSLTIEYPVYTGSRTLRLTLNILETDGRVFGISVFGQDITIIKDLENQLRRQLTEINSLKLHLEEENIYLRQEIKNDLGFEKIVGESDVLQYVLFRAKQVAVTNATVLILGETGTGKGMVAHAIHEMSTRKDSALITVNCAALPANLIESELFGHEKGAFTGAHAKQMGRFELANGGTIFLDEIGEMPLELQSKLLRVLQDGEFEKIGSPRTIRVDMRVIAATSRDLKDEVRNGRFREDLFYRLNVFPVSIPPLRIRSGDIPQLVKHFVDKYARKFGRQIESVSKSTMQILQSYPWPGNVRELEHVVERAIITSTGSVLQLADHLDHLKADEEESNKDLETVEREHILTVLRKTHWKIDGKGGAAATLGLNPSTLRFRIKKMGITRS